MINPLQARLLEMIFRMVFYGEKPQKATTKEIRLRMSLLSSLCIYVLFFFHYMKQFNWIFDLDKINIFLPMIFAMLPFAILFGVLYWIPARISIVLGIWLTIWVVVETIYRTINV